MMYRAYSLAAYGLAMLLLIGEVPAALQKNQPLGAVAGIFLAVSVGALGRTLAIYARKEETSRRKEIRLYIFLAAASSLAAMVLLWLASPGSFLRNVGM